MSGLYIHIPFCRQACHYCDFHFSTNLDYKAAMVDAICKEIILTSDYLNGESLESIYFGGGTPSLLSNHELETIFETIHKNYTVNSNAEVTFESNPDDLMPSFIKDLLRNGINRLSIGIQSFNDDTLKFLHRVHDSNQSLRCIKEVQEAGFNNISIDLIYGIPAKNHGLWENDLDIAVGLDVTHISSYCLTIEPKTVFGKWLRKGTLQPIEEEFSAKQFEMLVEHLEKHNFQQYEISNFCKNGYMALHNSNYWLGKNYLGIGPGAHSYNGGSRQFNISNNISYIKTINDGKVPYEVEKLTEEMKINEYIMTSIRTAWGCNLSYLEQFPSFNAITFEHKILHQIPEGLIYKENQHFKLTLQGKLLADEITHKLFL